MWKDFLFGVAATLGTEFVLALAILAIALLRSERAANRLLKAAVKPREKAHD